MTVASQEGAPVGVHQAQVDEFFESEARFWNQVYSDHDVFAQIHQERLRIAVGWIEGLGLETGASVLDAGAGAGVATVALARRGLAVTAVDPAAAMIAEISHQARAAGAERLIVARSGDVHTLPFGDATFEAVISLGVIPWLHSPRRALTELVRVLRPGGWLVVNCDNRARLHLMLDPWFWPPVASLRRSLRMVVRSDSHESVRAATHFRRQFQGLLQEAGLEIVEGRMFGFGPFTVAGRRALPHRAGRWADRQLSRLSEAGVPVFRSTGSQYIALCRRPFSE
jgi:ubiquinone/menaquinone biosynthesis C-methylase UbiE